MVHEEGFTLAEMLAALFVVSLVTIGLAGLTRQYAYVVQLAASSAAEHRALATSDTALARLIFASPASRTCSDTRISGSCIALDARAAPCSVSVTQESNRYKLVVRDSEVTTIPLQKPARLECTARGVTIWLKEAKTWRTWSNSIDLGI